MNAAARSSLAALCLAIAAPARAQTPAAPPPPRVRFVSRPQPTFKKADTVTSAGLQLQF